jgi:hypothetical protein
MLSFREMFMRLWPCPYLPKFLLFSPFLLVPFHSPYSQPSSFWEPRAVDSKVLILTPKDSPQDHVVHIGDQDMRVFLMKVREAGTIAKIPADGLQVTNPPDLHHH